MWMFSNKYSLSYLFLGFLPTDPIKHIFLVFPPTDPIKHIFRTVFFDLPLEICHWESETVNVKIPFKKKKKNLRLIESWDLKGGLQSQKLQGIVNCAGVVPLALESQGQLYSILGKHKSDQQVSRLSVIPAEASEASGM